MTSTMDSTRVTFRTSRMTNSTELKRLRMAIESTYYFCLFTEPDYAGRSGVWRAWARMGFATGLQEGPPGAGAADRIRISTFSNRKELTFSVAPAHARAGERWLATIREADARRVEVAQLPAVARAAALGDSRVIRELVGDPVTAAVEALAEDDCEVILRAYHQALASFTYPIIEQCSIDEHVPALVG